ncbi:MAG: hypothetical protein H7201_04235 [Candidatus Saccharibacteria bacterium]|nr:hypothetical protein [Microbacteriaceae bacterium]
MKMPDTQRVDLLLKPILGTLLPSNDFRDWPALPFQAMRTLRWWDAAHH